MQPKKCPTNFFKTRNSQYGLRDKWQLTTYLSTVLWSGPYITANTPVTYTNVCKLALTEQIILYFLLYNVCKYIIDLCNYIIFN